MCQMVPNLVFHVSMAKTNLKLCKSTLVEPRAKKSRGVDPPGPTDSRFREGNRSEERRVGKGVCQYV